MILERKDLASADLATLANRGPFNHGFETEVQKYLALSRVTTQKILAKIFNPPQSKIRNDGYVKLTRKERAEMYRMFWVASMLDRKLAGGENANS